MTGELKASDFVIEGPDRGQENAFAVKPLSYARDAWNRFVRNTTALAAAVLLVLLILMVTFGPLLSG